MDFDEINTAFAPILEKLDHYYLNEVAGLWKPDQREFVSLDLGRLKPELPVLVAVEIKETCTVGCIYRGE